MFPVEGLAAGAAAVAGVEAEAEVRPAVSVDLEAVVLEAVALEENGN